MTTVYQMLVKRPTDTTATARILNLATPSNASIEKRMRAKVRTEILAMNVKVFLEAINLSRPWLLYVKEFTSDMFAI